MEEVSSNSIVESREELMISSTDHATPISRTAHFLKPSIPSGSNGISKPSSLSFPSLPASFDPRKWPLTVRFDGWRNPQQKWREWVGKMVSLHKLTWRKAGIHEAILNSTYHIHPNSDLILGFAERWCRETNSFIFPWGEVTITLEDMMISGYSVLGCPVFKPLDTDELEEIKNKLMQARKELVRSRAKKASQHYWLGKFMNSGSELEHEAFLSLWLSRFVFPTANDVIRDSIFPIAVYLAKGTRIALAPAVLAAIYSDLSLLKRKIITLPSLVVNSGDDDKDNNGDDESQALVPTSSPLQLVLVWAWERFIKLRSNPNMIKIGEPRFAQWHGIRCMCYNLRLVLDSCRGSFMWRPYTKFVENWDFPKFYREKDMWVSMNSGLDEELESFIRCLRVCELVGMQSDRTQQYLPHRVARQFGIDQDVPDFVASSGRSHKAAWSFYDRPIGDEKCYIPSRHFETEVTKRYMEWWKRSGLDLADESKSNVQQGKCSTCLRKILKLSKEQHKREKSDSCNDILDPPGFTRKCESIEVGDSSDDDDLKLSLVLNSRKKDYVEESLTENVKSFKTASDPGVTHSSSIGKVMNLPSDESLKFSKAAVEDGQGSHGRTAPDQFVNYLSSSDDQNESSESGKSEGLPSSNPDSEPLTSLERVKLNKKKGVANDKNAATKLGQSPSPVAATETAENSEMKAIAGQRVWLTETGGMKQEDKNTNESNTTDNAEGNGSRNREENSEFSLNASIMNLEDQIRRLEKEVADHKAVVLRRMCG